MLQAALARLDGVLLRQLPEEQDCELAPARVIAHGQVETPPKEAGPLVEMPEASQQESTDMQRKRRRGDEKSKCQESSAVLTPARSSSDRHDSHASSSSGALTRSNSAIFDLPP